MNERNGAMINDHIGEMETRPITDSRDNRIRFSRKSNQQPTEDEIKISRFLADYYDTGILFLPVRDITDMKNPDILIGCDLAEMKHIVGKRRQIGKAFRKAVKQAQTIILWIEPDKETLNIKSIRNKIHGEIEEMIKKKSWDKFKPQHLIIIFENKLHSWRLYKNQSLSKN